MQLTRKRKRIKPNARAASAKPGGFIILKPRKDNQPKNRAEWLNFKWLQIGEQLKHAI